MLLLLLLMVMRLLLLLMTMMLLWQMAMLLLLLLLLIMLLLLMVILLLLLMMLLLLHLSTKLCLMSLNEPLAFQKDLHSLQPLTPAQSHVAPSIPSDASCPGDKATDAAFSGCHSASQLLCLDGFSWLSGRHC
ncbi:unnamed protein product [Lampetra fluviatilis]